MANLGGMFDPSTVPEGDNNFEVFPAGWYEMQIIESDVKKTKDETGKYVALSWEILGPSYAGRRVFSNVNIINKSQQAQEIGQRQLANVCAATGVGAIEDTEELHYKPCLGLVAIEPAKDGYEAKNIVKRWKEIGGVAEQPAQAPAQRPTQAAAQARSSSPASSAATNSQTASIARTAASASTGSRPWARK